MNPEITLRDKMKSLQKEIERFREGQKDVTELLQRIIRLEKENEELRVEVVNERYQDEINQARIKKLEDQIKELVEEVELIPSYELCLKKDAQIKKLNDIVSAYAHLEKVNPGDPDVTNDQIEAYRVLHKLIKPKDNG